LLSKWGGRDQKKGVEGKKNAGRACAESKKRRCYLTESASEKKDAEQFRAEKKKN